MVQTRAAYRAWVQRREEPDYQDSQDCNACSQHSDNNDNAFDPNDDPDDDGPHHAQYGGNDHCKRHRKADGHGKTEEVVSYRRRKPL